MRKYTLTRDFHDTRDLTLTTFGFLTKLFLPPKLDLSTGLSVYNQGQIGSCQSNAGCTLWKYESKKGIEPSRLFLYYNIRKANGTIPQDTGGTVRETMKAINTTGVSKEDFDQYLQSNFAKEPSNIAKVWGNNTKSTTYTRVFPNLIAIKKAIAQNHLVEFGMIVYDSFETDPNTWNSFILPLVTANTLGGHALTIVGYDDSTKMFKILNSWGAEWGNKGFFYIPYDRIITNDFFDFWMLTI